MKQQASAFSPASVGNVSVGFDLLGHALVGLGDIVTARRSDSTGVRINAVTGLPLALPQEAADNTAGRAVISLLQAVGVDFGVDLQLHKGIPLGSGLGGSAASATAAVVACNALLESPLSRRQLYPHALAGEAVASGSAHGDNIAPQLLGGLVLAAGDQLIELPVPDGLMAVVVHPDHVVETRRAREPLQQPFMLADIVAQQANLARVLCGCYRNDTALIGTGLNDVLVEPRRAALIPGFERVRQAARDHGALGAGISGAGPSVFAWFDAPASGQAEAAGQAMQQGFLQAGLDSQLLISPVAAPGARLLEDSA